MVKCCLIHIYTSSGSYSLTLNHLPGDVSLSLRVQGLKVLGGHWDWTPVCLLIAHASFRVPDGPIRYFNTRQNIFMRLPEDGERSGGECVTHL